MILLYGSISINKNIFINIINIIINHVITIYNIIMRKIFLIIYFNDVKFINIEFAIFCKNPFRK